MYPLALCPMLLGWHAKASAALPMDSASVENRSYPHLQNKIVFVRGSWVIDRTFP